MPGDQREQATFQPSCFDLEGSDPASIGGYELVGRLGVGGMGVVYLGRDGGRQVAIKVIREDLVRDDGYRARFAREIQACRRVSGEHTARIVSADENALVPWLATEFIPAPHLEDLVRARGPFDYDSQTALATGLAEALVELHKNYVVHRDLKPTNVLCPKEGPRVIDFGVATARGLPQLTMTGLAIGSPGWMAPEQIDGICGPSVDIFAWAAVVSYAASGKPPFGQGPVAEIFWRVSNAEPSVEYELLAPALRPLVRESFSKDPGIRPTALEIRERLSVLNTSSPPGRNGSEAFEPGATTVSQKSRPAKPSSAYGVGIQLRDSDPAVARVWLERAAAEGSAEAMFDLARLIATEDPSGARDWYERAAMARHSLAAYRLATMLRARHPSQARYWYEQAARDGNSNAMNNLGVLLQSSEPETARDWYERAARAGNKFALFNAALLMEAQDIGRAQRLHERAAAAGSVEAMYRLGSLLQHQRSPDCTVWYQRAAEAGHPKALRRLRSAQERLAHVRPAGSGPRNQKVATPKDGDR